MSNDGHSFLDPMKSTLRGVGGVQIDALFLLWPFLLKPQSSSTFLTQRDCSSNLHYVPFPYLKIKAFAKMVQVSRNDPQSNKVVPRTSTSTENLVDLGRTLRDRSGHRPSAQLSRPLVETTVSAIATLARRFGMRWIDFRPEEGIMSAEGNGQLMYSALVRSIGVILHYRSTGPVVKQVDGLKLSDSEGM